MILLGLLLACTTAEDPDPVAQALRPGSDLKSCEALAFEELVTPCRLEVAAEAAAGGRLELADEACAGVTEPLWQEECWFQIGEHFARQGRIEDALRRCGRAGDFVGPCVSHIAWGQSSLAAGPVEALRAGAQAGLAELSADTRAELVRVLLSGYWLRVIYGSGLADPAAVRDAPPAQQALARTAYAAEAIRIALAAGLKPDEAHARVLTSWSGDPLRGARRSGRGRLGRVARAILPEAACALPHAPTWGGGQRLVGETEEEDLTIAALEGLFLQAQVPAQAFAPWLEDPRDRVRWTASKLFVLGGGPKVSPELAQGWSDPVQRAYLDQPDCRAQSPS